MEVVLHAQYDHILLTLMKLYDLFCAFIWSNLIFQGPVFFFFIFPILAYYFGYGFWLLVIYILYLPFFFDFIWDSRYKKEGRVWEAFRYFPVLAGVKNYLQMQLIYEGDLSGPQYLFGIHPHGHAALAANPFVNGYTDFNKKWPQLKLRFLAATVVFMTPVLKEIMIALGGVDASRQTAEYLLQNGYSVAIFPGGIEEQLNTIPDKYTLSMKGKKHTGIIRLSLVYGVPLVPCFAFGPPKYFTPVNFIKPFQVFLFKKFRMGIPLVTGRFGFPVPYANSKLNVVIGKPLVFPKIQSPTEDDIAKYQQEYIAAITNLFNQNKTKYGDERDVLQIS